jgi:2-iminobutanoate/2-iminopropanoate deaminase
VAPTMLRFISGLLSGAVIACAPQPVAENETAAVTFLNSGKVTPSTLPFSEAVRVGDMVYLSGQVGITPGSMTLVSGGMAAEAKQTMDNIRTSLEAHGLSLKDVVKCTVMLADMSEWAAFNEIYKSYFTPPYPARSALGASGLALGARVEVECIAAASATTKAPA